MQRLGLALGVVLFWAACGRVAEPCAERPLRGAELVRAGDVVLLGTVTGGELRVHRVLQGRLRTADGDRLAVEGLRDGLAVIPLRLVNGSYRPVVKCEEGLIPLRWMPEGAGTIEEILQAPAPSGMEGEITPGARTIVDELAGRN